MGLHNRVEVITKAFRGIESAQFILARLKRGSIITGPDLTKEMCCLTRKILPLP